MTTRHRKLQDAPYSGDRGVGLVELMVALALGLALSLAATLIYLDNKQTWSMQDNMSRIQETGRFAMRLLREEIRLAGYWGLNIAPVSITNAEPIVLTGECYRGWATSYTQFLRSANNSNVDYRSCIPDSDYMPDTDILTVLRSSSRTVDVGSIKAGHLYLYTSLTDGTVFIADADRKFDAGTELNEFPAALYAVRARAYYIRSFSSTTGDGIPTLVRETIGAGSVSAEPITELVEDLQLTFGLDSDGDGSVDVYEDGGIPGDDAKDVTTVVVEILVRAPESEAGYTNTREYRIGDIVRSFNDGYRRQIFKDTVFLRNRREPDKQS